MAGGDETADAMVKKPGTNDLTIEPKSQFFLLPEIDSNESRNYIPSR